MAHDETLPNPQEEEPPQDYTPCNVQQDEMDSTQYVQEDSPATVNAERDIVVIIRGLFPKFDTLVQSK